MRVLITGGAGFIGSHLAERHLNAGDHVSIIDDLSTGSVDNIERLKARSHFSYHIDDVTESVLMPELVDASDLVYHLAAAVGVRLIIDNPVHTIETNIRGTEIVLRLAAKKRKRVLIASTSEVYGKRNAAPFAETDDLVLGATTKARWSYACSKAIDEFLALAYWKDRRVPTVVVRLFNTVGPRQTGRYGMVVPTFVRQALAGQDISVYGDGSQTRCFAHVDDVVRTMITLIRHPDAVGEVYNVGNTQEVSILDLACRVKQLTGSNSRIVFVPYERAYERGFEDMMRRVPDLSKLHHLIGCLPAKDLDEILQSVIEYQRGSVAPCWELATAPATPTASLTG